MTVDRLNDYLSLIDESDHFPDPAEIDDRVRRIHRQHRAFTTLETIGESRAGRPLIMLTIGDATAVGARHAIVTGTPHPNEPTGALGALELAQLLVDDNGLLERLGMVWHVIPCADPDGAELNLGWYAGPFTRLHYAEHIYRPPFAEQYEWTFYRPDLDPPALEALPESSAVARLLDTMQPELLIDMHNGEGGGLFAYVTDDLPGMREGIRRVCRDVNLPPYQGIPEDHEVPLGPGLFLTADHAGGMLSSTDYARRHGTVGLVSEPPMWLDPLAADDSPSDLAQEQLQNQCDEARAELEARMTCWLHETQGYLDAPATARGRAVLEQLRHLKQIRELPSPVTHTPLTVALVRSAREEVLLERLRCTGHLVAWLRQQGARAPLNAALRHIHDDAMDALTGWATEEDEPEFVGLGAAVRGHVGIAITAARCLRQS